MCGITGLFDTRSPTPVDDAVRRMNQSQLHRGPDEGSLHIEPGLGFGHRRLSIIDVSTGQQPLFNQDRSICIVFNGEIYNFQQVRSELQALGYAFQTHSDTEVIVQAWAAWGEDCVRKLRGMFAFAIWDTRQEKLFIARDRLGIKPLYFATLDDGQFLFGSELKVLATHPGLQRRLDPLAVADVFNSRMWRLSGLVGAGERGGVIVDGQLVRVGQEYQGATLAAVSKDGAEFVRQGVRFLVAFEAPSGAKGR